MKIQCGCTSVSLCLTVCVWLLWVISVIIWYIHTVLVRNSYYIKIGQTFERITHELHELANWYYTLTDEYFQSSQHVRMHIYWRYGCNYYIGHNIKTNQTAWMQTSIFAQENSFTWIENLNFDCKEIKIRNMCYFCF